MTRSKGNSSRNSTQQTHTSSEGTARERSHRPRGRVGRFLDKVKNGANKLRVSRSKDSRSRSPLPPNVNHERASLTSVGSHTCLSVFALSLNSGGRPYPGCSVCCGSG
ncbi:hypothetical protein BDR03DRAFT_135037 [Suillus americanus]|nr:hypothetical protein BDR03DRAFT_135037 [Suillus americanus]